VVGGIVVCGVVGLLYFYYKPEEIRATLPFLAPYMDPVEVALLPPEMPNMYGFRTRTVVLGFEDTLVHQLWTREGYRLRKQPHVDAFIDRLFHAGYEIVLWASVGHQSEVEPDLNAFDPEGKVMHRLSVDHTSLFKIRRVKDLSRLNRDLTRVIFIDSDPKFASKQPENLIRIKPFFNEINDTELDRIAAFLENIQRFNVYDARPFIQKYNENPNGRHFQEEEDLIRSIIKKYSVRGPEPKPAVVTQPSGFGSLVSSFIKTLTGGSVQTPPTGQAKQQQQATANQPQQR